MASAAGETVEQVQSAPRRRWGWKRWLIGGVAALLALIVAALVAIDTPPGRRFIIDQIEALEPANGLRIGIGRIDGSIYGEMTISDLRLYDPEGLFFEAPEIAIDWRPLSFIFDNRLRIDSATSDLVILHRIPALIPSAEPQPILPGFDIAVADLDITRFRFGAAVTGEQRDVALAGSADIRAGRAVVRLRGQAYGTGERIVLDLDAEPDGDVFDIDLQLAAPENGIIAGLTGIDEALRIDISGSGSWTSWDGRALIDSGAERVANLNLEAREGAYTLGGLVRTGPLLDPGVAQRLTAPEMNLTASATFEDRRLDGNFAIRSRAAVIEGRGAIDLAENSFDGFVADIRLLDPSALAADMRGTDVRLNLRLDGPFARSGFAYRLTAPRAAFGTTGVENLRVEGEGRLTDTPYVLPLSARASRVTGVGDTAEGILRNVRIDGDILITGEQIVGDGLRITSDRLRGDLAVVYDFASGRYAVGLDGDIDRFEIPGLGIFDLRSRVDVRPGPGGRFAVTGRARAVARRIDNALFRTLANGLPVIDLDIAYGPDGRFVFTNTRLRSPGLSFNGRGALTRDGRLALSGSGSSAQYGAFEVTAQGAVSRPQVALMLANPVPGAGLENVALNLDPTPQGYAYRAAGASMAGPFTSNGAIVLPSGAPVSIEVAELLVADTRTTGQLTLTDAGFVGDFDLTGSGLNGTIALAPVNGVQSVRVDLDAEDATLGGQVATTIRQGMLELEVLLYDDAPQINAAFNAVGVRREGLSIARAAGTVDMRGSTGTATASIAGARGREFDFALQADIAPDAITVNGGGEFEHEPIRLTPVRIRRDGPAWILEQSTIEYAGGGATLSGRFGGTANALDATLDNIPLSVADIFYPEIGFGGNATGTIVYFQGAGDAVPTADVELRVRSLTREGFALRPRPVNLGVNARLSASGLAARGIMESDGDEILRAQVRVAPFSGSGNFGDQLAAAPLFAEMRYSGPAETIWQLTGNETLSLSGPLIGRADASGTLSNPDITGSIRTENGRLESTLTGTVVEGISTEGRFEGSRFTLPGFTGTTPGGGSVSGSATFDLGLATGLGMNVQLQTDQAWLLRRDDISARVSGPISIVLQAPEGTAIGTRTARPVGRITGDLDLIEGEFALGMAAPSVTVPQLNVTEINRRLDEPVKAAPPVDWQVDFAVDARNRFLVRGLGLDSEWSANLQVTGPLDAFRILGRMDLVRGGYEFAGRRFDLERGRIDFYGNSPIDPGLDIVAEASVEGLDAQINIAGTGSAPEITFTSTPALPQSELLSRLLFGTSITNLSAPEALQLGAAVASLQGGGGGGLNPINAVRDAIGLDRLRVLPADPAEDRGTAVAAGIYVLRNLYVEVITDGQGYSATSAEFRVTRWLSLLSSISTIGRASVNARISRDY